MEAEAEAAEVQVVVLVGKRVAEAEAEMEVEAGVQRMEMGFVEQTQDGLAVDRAENPEIQVRKL